MEFPKPFARCACAMSLFVLLAAGAQLEHHEVHEDVHAVVFEPAPLDLPHGLHSHQLHVPERDINGELVPSDFNLAPAVTGAPSAGHLG